MRRDISSGKAVTKSHGKSCYRVKRQRGTKTDKATESDGSPESPDDSIHSIAPAPAPVPLLPTTMLTQVSLSSTPKTGTVSTAVVHGWSEPPRQVSLPYQLAHANDTSRFLQSILSDIRSHVCNVFTHQPNWHHSRTSKIGLISAYNYLSYDHFVIAMDAFLKNEHKNGGEILRRAFLEVEDAIQTDYSSTFYFLFIDLPDLFLQYGRHDILTILLGHIKRLTSAARLRDKISGTGFAALHALVETDPAHLHHYITTSSALWCDLLSELRGPRDRSTLLAKRNYLRHTRGTGQRYRVSQLCEDYTILLQEVHDQFGPTHNMSRHMEDVILSTQMIHDYFLKGFVGQNERLIKNVEEKYLISNPAVAPLIISTASPTILNPTAPMILSNNNGSGVIMPTEQVVRSVPLECWDVLDHNIRSNCYQRLAYFYSHQLGDIERAQGYYHKAREGWRHNFWQLEAETALVGAGRHFEAESLRRCRLEAQYFRKLPESNEMVIASGQQQERNGLVSRYIQ